MGEVKKRKEWEDEKMKKRGLLLVLSVLMLLTALVPEAMAACKYCNGSGEWTVKHSNHEDRLACMKCGWTGSKYTYGTCDLCYGSGRFECWICLGSGKFLSSTCTNCHGSGKESCIRCSGLGQSKQSRYECPNCSAGRLACSTCKDLSDRTLLPCPYCKQSVYKETFNYRSVMR